MKLIEKVAAVLVVLAVIIAVLNPREAKASEADNIMPFKLEYTIAYQLEKSNGTYHVYLGKQIIEDIHYEDLLDGLRKLTENDRVTIHMANYGGYVSTGVRLINAMKASKAHITVTLEAPSYSMGALITCAADTVVLQPYSFLMFHHYSGTFRGKGSEILKQVLAMDELVRNLMIKECVAKDILTIEQVNQILEGGRCICPSA